MRFHLTLACLFLSACSGLPSAVKNVPVKDVSYNEASQNPDAYKGTPVRWGGVIIDVDNEQNYTLVQVLSHPLTFSGRPDVAKPSGGRFVIKSSEFLDPAVYEKDREITVAGILEGDIERTVGKKTVRVPLVSSTAHYLWPVYQNVPYGGSFGPYFGYGYYGSPYYWGAPYYWPYRW
jgi:outer membrane lipoprotein